MNERIHILAEQAGLYCSGTPDAWDQESIERFSQLIVGECVGVVTDAVDHREPASTYADKIRQHFGVE
jgi:hypothetical protein